MLLAFIEVVIFVVFIWFVMTQLIIPVLTNTKTFPIFRGNPKKAVLEDMILEEKDKIEVEELRHSLNELRQKEKKDGQV